MTYSNDSLWRVKYKTTQQDSKNLLLTYKLSGQSSFLGSQLSDSTLNNELLTN